MYDEVLNKRMIMYTGFTMAVQWPTSLHLDKFVRLWELCRGTFPWGIVSMTDPCKKCGSSYRISHHTESHYFYLRY